jgi:hypothetical protein
MAGFTSLKDMFDGGGAGGAGREYSFKSHEEYKNDYKAKHGKDDPNASAVWYVQMRTIYPRLAHIGA